MGSTSVKARQAGVLVAILRGAGRIGLIGLAAVVALACAPRSSGDPTPRDTDRPAEAFAAPDGVTVETLRVGTSGDYAPFSHWPEEASAPSGFSVDVVRAFAQTRGARIDWVRFRWSELARDLEAGRFDLALSGITVRPDRSTLGRFSLPLTATAATALVLAAAPLESPSDLERPGLRIAVNRGGHLERVARTRFARARIEAVGANAAVPGRLADGRADAVLTDDLEAPLWQRALPPTRAIGPLTRDRKAAWFPLEKEDLLLEFNRWLLAAEASGELARLRARHGLADSPTAAPLPALLARLDERLALMPGVARAKHVLALPIRDPAQEERVRAAARETAARAAREFGVEPPRASALRRFVDAQLAAARFVQDRELAGHAGAETDRRAEAADGASSSDAARVELEERLRPAVAYLMDRSLWLAVACIAEPRAASANGARTSDAATRPASESREAVADALADHALPPELVKEIQSALDGLIHPHAEAHDPDR